jgi:large subunit ribosomal protein L5
MHFLKISNKKIIKHDLINKFKYNNIQNIPEFKQLTFNFGCKNFNIQNFATTLLASEIIASKKGALTVAKNANVLLKIQKGQPAGCKVILKKKEIDTFLNKLLIEILPRVKNFLGFKISMQTSTFSFKLFSNEIALQEFENQYPLFANLPNLDIHISTNSKSKKELMFLIKSYKIPIYTSKTKKH